MKLPPFNHHGLLPAFDAGEAVKIHSPYRVSITEVVDRFGTSVERLEILDGLMRYRAALTSAGFTIVSQWLDGSFVEDKENDPERGQPPGDIDVVSLAFGYPDPLPETLEWAPVKQNFHVDGYFIDLSASSYEVVASTTYWIQLFGHSRRDMLWKGIIEVPFAHDDDEAVTLINQRRRSVTRA